MKRENISDAMNMVDDDLLLGAEKMRSGNAKKRRFPKLAVAAAAIAVMVCGGTVAAAVGGHFVDIKNIFGAVTGTQYVNATEEISVEFLGFKNGAPDLDIKPVNPEKAPYNSGVMKLASYNITDERGNVVVQKTFSEATESENVNATDPDAQFNDSVMIDYSKLTPTGKTSDLIIQLLKVNENWEWYAAETRVQHYEGYVDPETGEVFWKPTSYDVLDGGTYTVNIESFVIESKADQPLEIFGDWEVEFTI